MTGAAGEIAGGSGRRLGPREKRDRDKFEDFCRMIMRPAERNCETGRVGIDETESELLRLAPRPGPFSDRRQRQFGGSPPRASVRRAWLQGSVPRAAPRARRQSRSPGGAKTPWSRRLRGVRPRLVAAFEPGKRPFQSDGPVGSGRRDSRRRRPELTKVPSGTRKEIMLTGQ